MGNAEYMGVLKECCMMGGSVTRTALLFLFVGVLAVNADVKRVYWDVVADSCRQLDFTSPTVCTVRESNKPSVTDDFRFYHASLDGGLTETDPKKVMIFSSHDKNVIASHLIVNSANPKWDKSKGGYIYRLKSDLESLNIIMMDYYLSKRVGKSIGKDESFFGKGHDVDYLGSFMNSFIFQTQGGMPINHHGWYNEWDQDESVFAVKYGGETMADFDGDPYNFKTGAETAFVLAHCHEPKCDNYDLYTTGFEEDTNAQTTAKSVAQRWLEGTKQPVGVDFEFIVDYYKADGTFQESKVFTLQRFASLARAGPPRDHAKQEGEPPHSLEHDGL